LELSQGSHRDAFFQNYYIIKETSLQFSQQWFTNND
jgi:hypothetical protein